MALPQAPNPWRARAGKSPSASRRRAPASAPRTTWQGRGLRSSRQLRADVAFGRHWTERRRARHIGGAAGVEGERIAILARVDEAKDDVANAADAEHAVAGVGDDDVTGHRPERAHDALAMAW